MSLPTRKLTHRQRLGLIAAAVALVIAIGLWRWPRPTVTIGVEGRVEATIAGPELTAVPYTHGDALAVRIVQAERVDEGFRYDLRYMAYGPGKHDLLAYLVDDQNRRPKSPAQLPVSVRALLPAEVSGKLIDTPTLAVNLHTNYRWYMMAMWCAWGLLLVPLWFYGRRSRRHAPQAIPEPTIPERLQQLLERAAKTPLAVEEQTDLEKLLLAYWSERLELKDEQLLPVVEALRQHPVAGPQWTRVERWLHSGVAASPENVAQALLVELRREPLAVVGSARG